MLCMVSYPRRPQSGHITCYLNRTYHVLPTVAVGELARSLHNWYSFSFMYRDFHALDRWTKKQVHCFYQALIVAVATRHADAVDIKFLVDGRPVWVALPLVAWTEYKN